MEWTKKWGWTQTKGVSYSSTYNREFSAKSRTQVLLDRISYEYIPAVKSKAYFRELLAKMYEAMLTSANSELTAVSIIDANYKHLECKSDNAKMATKIEFANYVKDNPASFDFFNFKKIYDIIKEIVSTHERK